MKKGFKKSWLFLITSIFMFAFAGCAEEEIEYSFEFSYELEQTEFQCGDAFELKVSVTNVSGRTYTYFGGDSDFSPYITIFCIQDEEVCKIPIDRTDTDDMTTIHIPDGKTRNTSEYIEIPLGAPLGPYSMTLSCFGFSKLFENIFTVVE